MRHKKARDIMVPVEGSLRPETSVKEAVIKLKTARRGEQNYGVKCLPVVDDKGALAGLLSIGDIKKAIYPSYMVETNLGDVAWDGMLESMARRLKEKTVGQIMSRDEPAVPEDAPLMDCLDHMMKHDATSVPVVDKDGRVVGMVYERDLFNVVTDAIFALDNDAPGGK